MSERVDEYTGRTVPWPKAPPIEQAMADAGSSAEFAVNPWANGIPEMATNVQDRLLDGLDRIGGSDRVWRSEVVALLKGELSAGGVEANKETPA